MKLQHLIMAFVFVMTTALTTNAQTKKAKSPATPKMPTKCMIFYNGAKTSQMKATDAMAWCDSLPLMVIGDNGVKYKLKTFDVMVIQKDPFLSQDFGTAEGGMPLLAYKAIERSKEGDSVFLKNVTYADANNQLQKLPNCVISIIN